MAIPKVTGDNPVQETIPKDVWSLIAEDVNVAKIHSNFDKTQTVWMTYVKTGDAAPTAFNAPMWSVPDDFIHFEDSATSRDLYLFPVNTAADVTIEV